MTIKHRKPKHTLNKLPRMKIILITACILSVSGVVDVVAAADKQLRGSSRALQYAADNVPLYGAYGGPDSPDNDRPPQMSNDPTRTSTSVSFQLPPQPIPTLGDSNAPVLGSNPSFAIFPNSGFLPTDFTGTSIFGGLFGSVGGGDIKNNFGTWHYSIFASCLVLLSILLLVVMLTMRS
jgi:hypothetical protein